MSDIIRAKKITDLANESKGSRIKSEEAQKLLSDFFKTKSSKDLDRAFGLLNEANKLNPKSIEPYLALSCMYYIKNKKEISLGILYKAKEYEKNNEHLNSLILDLEDELVNIQIKKHTRKLSR